MAMKKNWSRVRLGSVFDVCHGKCQHDVECRDGAYPILATGGMIGRTNHFLYDKPSVLIGRKGTLDKPQYIDSPFWTIDTLFYTKIKDGFNPKFVYYLCTTIDWNSLNEASGVPSLSASRIENLEVRIPLDEAEQKRIACALGEVDGYREVLSELREKYEAMKRGMVKTLLSPKPSWKTTRLGEVANIVMGQSPDSAGYNSTGDGLPLIQGNADIKDRKTICRTYTKQITKRAEKGDIILTVRAPVGNVARATFDCCLGRGVCALKNASPYLFYYFEYIEPTWGQISTGSTFDSINSDTLKNFELPLPSLSEQREIAKKIEAVDGVLGLVEAEEEKAESLKCGLMKHFFG